MSASKASLFVLPSVWTQEQLLTDKQIAEKAFLVGREAEGPDAFYRLHDVVEPEVRRALELTADLREITGKALIEEPQLWHTLRYFGAPPISEEDLWTVVGRKFKRVPADAKDRTAEAIGRLIDVRRFPWVPAGRAPTTTEREKAIHATTLLMAHERLKTGRRGSASKLQEQAVADALRSVGFGFDESRSPINVLDGLARGHFSRERKVAGAKCDVPVRLRDGRLLALECKVSNGPKNSWKRLTREAGGKAETWRQSFGTQVVTGAVLAGVYDLKCLERAQRDHHVAIFWQHNLEPLLDFVASVK